MLAEVSPNKSRGIEVDFQILVVVLSWVGEVEAQIWNFYFCSGSARKILSPRLSYIETYIKK